MLPEIAVPVFETTLPSSGQKIKYRPYLVKEEKILLMAHQGNDPKEISSAVKNLLQSCVRSDLEVEKLPSFDLEWLFLKIRGKSVGEVVDARMHVPKEMCGKSKEKCLIDIEADLEKVAVKEDKEHDKKVQLTDDVGVVFGYPNMEILGELTGAQQNNQVETVLEIISRCVKQVYDKSNVYEKSGYDGDWDLDIKKLLDNLSRAQMEKVSKFFTTMPKISCHIKQKCPECQKVVERDIEGIMDFFI